MDQRSAGLDIQHDDKERRGKVRQWLGEKATSFALAETNKQYEEKVDALEVREYQLDAWASLWEARQNGDKRALIHLATGLGKTSVAVFDVMKFREEQLAQNPPTIPRILFVSHMNDISGQAHGRFKQFLPDLETTYFKAGQDDLPEADITFATFQSLHNEIERFDPQDFEYIIYDEAHHSEANTFKRVREHFDPLFELALTATPNRMDDRDIKEYFGKPLYSKTLAEGIAEGWLVDVDYHIVFDDIVKQLMDEGFEPKTLKEFHGLFRVRPRNEVIARNIREEQHRIGLDDAKTIVFCESVTHAEEMAELLGGIAYHSDIRKEDRKAILKDFRIGGNQIICTVDMFNEGVDIPDARLLVFLRSTQSDNIFEQQLGRGLRRAPGKERVSVLDFVANIERIQKVRDLSRKIRNVSSSTPENSSGSLTDATPANEEDGVNDAENGIQIHTQHSNFDFDRITVDLLKKFTVLSITAPEGWISTNAAASELGIGRQSLLKLAKEFGWELPRLRFGNFWGYGISQEQVDFLKTHPWVGAEEASEFLSIHAMRDKYGLHDVTINKMVEAMGWKLPYVKFGAQRSKALSKEQIEELKVAFPDNFLEPMPTGFMSVREASATFKIGKRTLAKRIEEKGWALPRYKSRGGPAVDALSPGQLAQLGLYDKKEDIDMSNVVSFVQLGKEMKMAPDTLRAAAQKAGVEANKYKFHNFTGDGVKREDIETIISALPPIIPNGWLTVAEAATELGVSVITVANRAKKKGWTLSIYRKEGDSKPVKTLSPRQVQELYDMDR